MCLESLTLPTTFDIQKVKKRQKYIWKKKKRNILITSWRLGGGQDMWNKKKTKRKEGFMPWSSFDDDEAFRVLVYILFQRKDSW